MKIAIKCVQCGTAVRADSGMAGRHWTCPNEECKYENVVPSVETAGVEAPAEGSASEATSPDTPLIPDFRSLEAEETFERRPVRPDNSRLRHSTRTTVLIVLIALSVIGVGFLSFEYGVRSSENRGQITLPALAAKNLASEAAVDNLEAKSKAGTTAKAETLVDGARGKLRPEIATSKVPTVEESRASSIEKLPGESLEKNHAKKNITSKFRCTFHTWRNPEPPLRLIHKDEGFCYLAGVGGAFNGGAEVGYLEIRDDGFWYLHGRTGHGHLVVTAVAVTLTADSLVAEIKSNPGEAIGPVFLSDLGPSLVRAYHVHEGSWGFGGNGYIGHIDLRKIVINGADAPHSMSALPPGGDESQITYHLRKGYKRLSGQVALDDRVDAPLQQAVSFRIVGDSKELWESRPISVSRALSAFDLDITNVDRLDLIFVCPGPQFHAHGVWVNPVLTK